MRIKRTCLYCTDRNYNILPALLFTPKPDGWILAFKWWGLHTGIYIQYELFISEAEYGNRLEAAYDYDNCWPDGTGHSRKASSLSPSKDAASTGHVGASDETSNP